MNKIKTLDGSKPHPSWGGWRKFLKSCDVRGKCKGVTFFGKTNCNYVLFPDGTLVQNFGFHGEVLMKEIKATSPAKVLVAIKMAHEKMQALFDSVKGLG